MNTSSKAAAIREILQGNTPYIRTQDVRERLKARGIEVSAQQISNEKARQRSRPASVEDLPVSVLIKLNALVEEVGSIEIVKKAIDELARLKVPGPRKG